MLNSERFLIAYNKIEKHLLKITKNIRGTKFYQLIDFASKTSSAVKHFNIELKELADLRNAIVHERTDEHVLAEPNDRTVKEIENIESLLSNPPKVIPLFQKTVFYFSENDLIGDALKLMHENTFSQLPVRKDNGSLGLLTANTISRWLGANVINEIFSLSETKIREVLNFEEDADNYCILSRDSDLFEALNKFKTYEKQGKRLESILITHSGKKSEQLLGIITIWDLPKIFETISNDK